VQLNVSLEVRVRRFPEFLILALLASLYGAVVPAWAQDDPNDRPLGDVARSMRKDTAARDVIDNDNLPQVMDQAESKHATGSALKFLMAGESKDFQVATPDVTCSLSFRASTKSLLVNQYAQMDLPPREMLKLSGPATVEGDALTVSVFNGTDWHVSEIAVALMVIKKFDPAISSESGVTPPGMPGGLAAVSDVRPEKKPDVTAIYKMRAAAAPSAVTVFSAPLNLDLSANDEWHWAIVQAKGYPPQGNSEPEAAKLGQPAAPAVATPVVPSSLLLPQEEPAGSLTQNPR
jgi:hypothetical protein